MNTKTLLTSSTLLLAGSLVAAESMPFQAHNVFGDHMTVDKTCVFQASDANPASGFIQLLSTGTPVSFRTTTLRPRL